MKGDVLCEHVLVETKYTDKKQFTLKIAELEKIEREALAAGRMPVFAVEFSEHEKEYMVLRASDFEWLFREHLE